MLRYWACKSKRETPSGVSVPAALLGIWRFFIRAVAH
jgi:hypothetical protein